MWGAACRDQLWGAVQGLGIFPLLWALWQGQGPPLLHVAVQDAADCPVTCEALRGDVSGSGLSGLHLH